MDGVSLRSDPRDATRTAFTVPRAWTGVACLAFLFATAYAIAVVVFRLPIPGLQGALAFRISLALHVELAVYFWLMASLAAQWSAAAGRRDGGLLVPGLAGVGTLLVALSPLAGGTPRMADYFPWLVGNAWFAAGFVLFSGAVAAAAIAALFRFLTGAEEPDWRGVGVTALPALAAAAAAGTAWLAGARSLESLAWAAGHTLLFAHVAAMGWEWRRLAGLDRGRDGALTRAMLWILAGVGVLLVAVPFLHPPEGPDYAGAYTASMAWLLWPPALVIGLLALRQSYAAGERTPLADSVVPRFLVTVTVIFFLIGNLLGALIDGATTLVTAHYHAAIGAVALSRMAMSYFAAEELAIGRPTARAVRRQLGAYAIALLLLFGGLTLGAVDAAPRKTPAGELVEKGPYFKAGMSISGVGGLFAIAGSLWLVANLMRLPAERSGRGPRDRP